MPVPHSSKSRHSSPPPVTSTHNGHKRTVSSNPGYSPTITSSGHQQKLNVVTRVAIEGKARRGQDGASIRMFLKITLPLDSITPGSTIPLFSEENVKVLTSQVHPLDHNSVPFNFSSTISPLLHNAARALSLPARSSENFNSAFGTAKSNSTPSSSRSSKSNTKGNTNGEASPIDVQYTGHILVSGYSISFVLPKVFLSPSRNAGPSDNEESLSRTPFTPRRSSVGEKSQAHFMAAIDLWVPFLCMPPRSPYLLSIPTPRCLHNHIKLRIFPPAVTNTSASLASLSSMEDESTSWDLTSDPHVTRSASSRSARANTYNSFADDESSEGSTTGTSDGCAIQGTFPSAERIRVRWAKPLKTMNIPGIANGRRRVGVEEVKGEMICTIRGKGTSASISELEGVLMSVEYKGQCKGVWFPGVAILLGLDVSLEAKGSDISWAQGYSNQWEIHGGPGYTGFDSGSSDVYNEPNSRASSFDSTGPQMSVPTHGQDSGARPFLMRASSTSSTSSLLRAPLPTHNIADYSFEGSNATMPPTSSSLALGTMSSISSLPISSSSSPGQLSQIRPPGSPITLHLNLNELQHPVNNIFTFTISGTVVVSARQTLARVNGLSSSHPFPVDKSLDLEPIILPRYTVLAADSESTTITVRNEVDRASVEVFHPTGNIHTDAQARKTVLQTGGFTRCGEDGGRIALKFFEGINVNGDIRERPLSRPRTPSNNVVTRGPSSVPISMGSIPSRAKRDGPPIIPSVQANITTLVHEGGTVPTDYAVRLCLKAPQLIGSEWLEFGMGYGFKTGGTLQSNATEGNHYPKVHIICASLDGAPVRAEMTTVSTPDTTGGAASFEELSKKAWISWGKVYAGTTAGGNIVMDYIVKERQSDPPDKGRKKPSSGDGMEMNIVLPTFSISIARLEVVVDVMPGLEVSSLRSNFHYHQPLPTGSRLLQYSLEEFSQPQLSLTIRKTVSRTPPLGVGWWFMLTWVLLSVICLWMYHIKLEMRQSAMASDNYFSLMTNTPFTMTTTIQENTTARRWFGDSCEEIVSIEMLATSSSNPSPVPTDVPPISKVTTRLPEWTPLPTQSSLSCQSGAEDALIDKPSKSILETYDLIPLRNMFASSWSNQHKYVLKQVLEKVMDTMEVVWSIFRKVYHYPLDPP